MVQPLLETTFCQVERKKEKEMFGVSLSLLFHPKPHLPSICTYADYTVVVVVLSLGSFILDRNI